MKLLLITALYLLLCVQNSLAQNINCPPNIDFESGNFSGWQCFVGTTNIQVIGGIVTNQINLAPSAPTLGVHEIVTAASGNDQYGGFPKLCPYGGTSSVKLGNDGSGSQAEGISYTFQIPASADTFSLTYYYAVVFEDPGHSLPEQPRFFVKAYDVLTGNLINCASYNYVSNGSLPGFQTSQNSGVLYKDWTPASIDFSGLSGRTVRLEFKTADCTLGGHFGYAYLDVGTGCGGVIAAGAYCISTNSVTLNAPFGFQNYRWYNNDYSTLIGSARVVTLSPPPALGSIFHVDMIPYPGYGCRDTADAILTVLPVPDTPIAVTNIYYCQFDNVSPLQATPVLGNELLWYNTPIGGVGTNIPFTPSTATNSVTSYYVSQKKLFGCESARKKITVTITPSPIVSFTINNNSQCENSNNFIFTSTSTNTNAGSIYQWSFGDTQVGTNASTATHTYNTFGNYTVKLKINNAAQCFREFTLPVSVVPKPIANFSFPSLVCENQTPIVLQNNSTVPSSLSNIANAWWNIDGLINSNITPIPFLHLGGNIPISMVAYTTEGCKSDTIKKVITIHYSPIPKFTYSSLLCDNEIIKFTDLSYMPSDTTGDIITKWDWYFDNVLSSSSQNTADLFTAGSHSIKLIATTNKGCNYKFADSLISINPKPTISINIADSCALRNIVYTAINTPTVPVDRWYWDFGKGLTERSQILTKYFTIEGDNTFTLIGKTLFGCKDTIVRPFTIYRNRSKAQTDTIVATDEVLQLTTSDTINVVNYLWTPNTDLSNTTIFNPLATNKKDQLYELNTLTKQGCDSYSKILVRRYDGPELYVPTAFTPNKDGKNDLLRVFPVGIKTFGNFSVYNRFGQLLFYTTNPLLGWDGNFKTVKLDPGNYVWFATAIDYKGKPMFKKGNVLLLR